VGTIPSGFFARGIVFVLTRPFHLFIGTEARGALLLLVATVAALVWVNSPRVASYESLWSTRLRHRSTAAAGRPVVPEAHLGGIDVAAATSGKEVAPAA
jgi:hypothetical protein